MKDNVICSIRVYIVFHWFFGWMKLFVVRTTTARVNESATNTADQQTIVNPELNNRVELSFPFLQQTIQLKNRTYLSHFMLRDVTKKKYLLTFSACTTVRGNPSRRKPFLHSGLAKLESIKFTTRSSLTSAPIFISKMLQV